MTMTDSRTGTGAKAGGSSFADLRRLKEEADQRAAELAEEAAREEDPYAGMSPKERRAAQRAARRLKGKFEDYTHLMAIKPKEGYVFHSDYYVVDGQHATVMGYFHDDESRDDFGAFWGINRIPSGMGEGVSVVVVEQVRRMGEKWIDDNIKTAEKIDKLEEGEQAETGTATSRRKAAKVSDDIATASAEIQDGASYLHVHNRIIIKAPTLERLDEAVEKIQRLYVDRFGTVRIAAYPGEQRRELGAVFAQNEKKRGKGQHFTSVELAGSHSLVTNGLNDRGGEYVGSMLGDVNNSAVLFDVNGFEGHVVVADSTVNRHLQRSRVPNMWGSKISQSCLLNNGRVVHLILDGADMDVLGPPLRRLTARLDMNRGDINMFEMFGDQEDELSIFPAHLDKIALMAEQAYQTTEDDRSVIRGSLKEILTQFYIDQGMWSRNAKENRERLRVVGIPHEQVPRLQDIYTYFETAYKALANSSAKDEEQQHAFNVLRLLFKDLLDNNGALFNTHTSSEIDGVGEARRVLYDFSGLMRHGKGVAMAQLVNVVGFAVDNLSLGDVVIVHGTEQIDDRVKEYINIQFDRLRDRGGRVAYLYNDIDKMLADRAFNRFDRADWTVLGPMTESTVAAYQKMLSSDIPPDLERLVTQRGSSLAYLRRGVTNVVFSMDLALGVNPARQARRDAIAAAMAEEDRIAQERAAREREAAAAALQPAPVGSRGRVAEQGRQPLRRRDRSGAPQRRTLGLGSQRGRS